MTFSWKELVCHGLLKKVGDPSLAKKLLKVAMKKHRDHLEEEAREYHTKCVGPILGVYRNEYLYFSRPSPQEQAFIAESQSVEGRESPPELWRTAINYKNVKKEYICNWVERRPYNRRGAIWSAFFGSWEEENTLLHGENDYSLILLNNSTEEENRVKCEWYEGIHEGRYYLFWHKDSFRQASRFTHWSVTASIDINVIEGRTVENPWGGVGYPDICWDPKYLRENNKEKKHLDDMFNLK